MILQPPVRFSCNWQKRRALKGIRILIESINYSIEKFRTYIYIYNRSIKRQDTLNDLILKYHESEICTECGHVVTAISQIFLLNILKIDYSPTQEQNTVPALDTKFDSNNHT